MWVAATQAQTIGYLRYDTVKVMKQGGRGSLDVTGNVRFTGLLPKSAGTDSVVVRDVNGNLGTTAKGSFGGNQTWQQTLTTGSTLNLDNQVNHPGKFFNMYGDAGNKRTWLMLSPGDSTMLFDLYNTSGARVSGLEINGLDSSINIHSESGKILMPDLTEVPGTHAVRYNSTTGLISYADTSTTSGGTPGGSNTEIQYNNAGSFGASASYSIDNTNLKIKTPGINVTNGYELGTSLSDAELSSSINSYAWALKSSAVKSQWWDGNSVISLHDTLFTLGGWISGPVVTDSIFYSINDGATWVGYSGLLPFACHTFVLLKSPDGWVYMLGGDYLSTATQQKSVYRTRDLVNWTLMTNNYGGSVRILGGGVVDDFGNLYWMGGQTSLNGGALNDIWKSTDGGATWSQIATGISVGGNSFLGKNISNNAVYFNGRVYVVGGGVYDEATPANFTYTKKVYSAALPDLTSWVAENDLPFDGGRQYNSVAVWDGKIWSVGGYNGVANTDSVGYMNKAGVWALYTGTVPTASHAAGLGVHKDRLFYVLGNTTNNAYMLSRGNNLSIPRNPYNHRENYKQSFDRIGAQNNVCRSGRRYTSGLFSTSTNTFPGRGWHNGLPIHYWL